MGAPALLGSAMHWTLVGQDLVQRANGGIGSSWTANTGTLPNIVGDLLEAAAAGDSCRCVYTPAAVTVNQYAQVLITTNTSTAGGCGPGVRMLTGTDTGYVCYTTGPLGASVTLNVAKLVAGGFTALTSFTGVNCPAGSWLALEAVGTTSTVLNVYANGVKIGTYTDSSSPLTTGKCGMVYYCGGSDALTALQFKEFSCGNVS